jgi:hypothetical protein
MVTKHNFVTRTLDRVRQAYCGLHGHDSMLQFEQDRMFLRCTSCGHESPGWEIADQQTTPVSEPQTTRQPALVRSPLVGIRRVA